MLNTGLSAAATSLLHQTFAGHHSVRVRVYVTDLTGNNLSEVSDRMDSGQVDVDTTQAPIRRCLLTLNDPARSMSFDSNSPEDGALWHDRMIRAEYEVTGPLLDRWYTIPVFHGPITKLSRDNTTVNVEAAGMELFGVGDSKAYTPWTYKKGSVRTLVIKSIAQKFMGQTAFDIADGTARTPYAYSLAPDSEPWVLAKSLARAENCNLFMDGRGVMVLRRFSNAPIFTFKEGDGGTLLTKPKVAFNTDNARNVVVVTGATGAHGPIKATAVAPNTHPLSPTRLGRNGVPRYMPEFISEDTIRTRAEANNLAQATLNTRLMQQVDVQIDVMVNPLLEEYDVVTVETEEFTANFQLSKFTIPLVVADGNTMNIGYMKNRPVKGRTLKR